MADVAVAYSTFMKCSKWAFFCPLKIHLWYCRTLLVMLDWQGTYYRHRFLSLLCLAHWCRIVLYHVYYFNIHFCKKKKLYINVLFYVCIWKISVNKFFLDQYLQFVVVSWNEKIPFLDPHLKKCLGNNHSF